MCFFQSLDVPGKFSVGASRCMLNFCLTGNHTILGLKGYTVEFNMLRMKLEVLFYLKISDFNELVHNVYIAMCQMLSNKTCI